MVAAYGLGSRGVLAPETQAKVIRLFAGVLLPIQGVTLWVAMLRFQHGFSTTHPNLVLVFTDMRSVNPFTGAWTLPVGPWLAVLLCLTGIGVLMYQFRAFANAGTVSGSTQASGTPPQPADTSPSASAPARP